VRAPPALIIKTDPEKHHFKTDPMLLIVLLFAGARRAAPPAPAPWKSIDLVSATCGAAAPGRPIFQIPSDFVVRTSAKGLTAGCLWGTPADLALVLGESETTFDRVERGVFQARLTATLGFDAATGKFEDEEGLAELYARANVGGVAVTRRTFGGLPALVVTGRAPNGAGLYLLYLALVRDSQGGGATAASPSLSEGEVLLISFHPPVNDPDGGGATWRHFLETGRAMSSKVPSNRPKLPGRSREPVE
jgi:hypothetical protein